MALTTPTTYRNQVIYSIFTRQYSQEGTFQAVLKDLPRIKALGVDILWLMPIHPIGMKNRKGTLGSPYANLDYRAINPELGTRDDFIELVDAIHQQGMKVIIDVVYNHTSPDSVLSKEHPEWFLHKADGSFGNKIGDWSDVIDLDYSHPELWDYQIETLKQWARYVDGFRCDVAPLVPLAFWLKARKSVSQVRPDCFWLAESVEPEMIRSCRKAGIPCLSDSVLYQAFDATYEYDIYFDFLGYLTGKSSLAGYAEKINAQEAIYPANYVKLRCLENHDRRRIADLVKDEKTRRNWTAFLYFQQGITLLYNGQEKEVTHQPSLFDKDPILWDTGHDQTGLLTRLAQLKKDPLFAQSSYEVKALAEKGLLARHCGQGKELVGLFQVKRDSSPLLVPLLDGTYRDLISNQDFTIEKGQALTHGEPVIFWLSK